jgi:hypothetical protein
LKYLKPVVLWKWKKHTTQVSTLSGTERNLQTNASHGTNRFYLLTLGKDIHLTEVIV